MILLEHVEVINEIVDPDYGLHECPTRDERIIEQLKLVFAAGKAEGARAEREACATKAREIATAFGGASAASMGAGTVALAIRARGQSEGSDE